MPGRKKSALQGHRMYLDPQEAMALSEALRADDTATIIRYDNLVKQRRGAEERLAAKAAAQAAAKKAAKSEERRTLGRNVLVAIVVIAVCVGGALAVLRFVPPKTEPGNDFVQVQQGGRHESGLAPTGPCDTSISNIDDDRETPLGGMKIGQTGWVTSWMLAEDNKSGDWIDAGTSASEGGGGTFNVCIQHTATGWEAWLGPDPISGHLDEQMAGRKPNWVTIKVHPQGQK